MTTDYDRVASSGQYGRRYQDGRYDDVLSAIAQFVGPSARVLERIEQTPGLLHTELQLHATSAWLA